MLANGKWLLIGGTTDSGLAAPAAILDPNTDIIEPLRGKLIRDRSWHSATLLPDGKVLIVGGLDKDGHVIADPEIFDPEQHSFEAAPSSGLSARAHHSATLLTDGTVLLAGGISNNDTGLSSADLWDFRTRTGGKLAAQMMPQRRPVARLLPDGSVLLSEAGDREINVQVYAPWLQSFLPSYAQQREQETTTLEGSVPENRATEVPADTIIGVRFSRRLLVESVNSAAVTLSDGINHLDARIVPAEEGMLVFLTPAAPLAPATRYMVAIDGAKDEKGSPIPYSILTFTTGNLPPPRAGAVALATARPAAAGFGTGGGPAGPASNSIASFVGCLNNMLGNKKATVADTVACIPDSTSPAPAGVCLFTVTMSTLSAQEACELSYTTAQNVKAKAQFPRVILDCPGGAANLRFRPSYTLCPTATTAQGGSLLPLVNTLQLDHIELGEDIMPITFTANNTKIMGSMLMGDIYVAPSKNFVKIPMPLPANVLSVAGGGAMLNCDAGCHKIALVAPVAKNKPQPYPPINPFGNFKGTQEAPLIIFTNEVDKNAYPGLGNVDPGKMMITQFENVCSTIRANKASIVTSNQVANPPKGYIQLTLPTLNVADALCTNLLAKVK